MGWLLGCPFQRSGRSSRRPNHVSVSPSRSQPRVPIHMFGVEIAGQQDRQAPAETGGQVRSDQWAGRRKVSRKDFRRFAANKTWMAVASKWVRPGTGTEWWTIPRRTKMALPPPCQSVCAMADIIGKPEVLARVRECLN
jgi:hypothetical protein